MSGFLLDTNVLSEFRKGLNADVRVREWDAATLGAARFTSVIVIAELRRGAHTQLRKDRDSGTAIHRWIDRVVVSFGDRILPVNLSVVDVWADLMAADRVPRWTH